MTATEIVLSTQSYIDAVQKIRGIQVQGREILIAYYRAVREVQTSGLWREGPYQSFERFLSEELGVAPQRWAHMCGVVDRFGEAWTAQFGFDAGVHVLRLPIGSEQETTALAAMNTMAEKRGGRPPSPEAVGRLVSQMVPAQRPVGRVETEEERLRTKVRELQDALEASQAEVARLKSELGKQ